MFYLQRRQADVSATQKRAQLAFGSNKLTVTTQVHAYNAKTREFDCFINVKDEKPKLIFARGDQCAVDIKENVLFFDGTRIFCSRSNFLNNNLIFEQNASVKYMYKQFLVVAGAAVFYIIGITEKNSLWIHRLIPSLENGFKRSEYRINIEEVSLMEGFVAEDSELAILFYDDERRIKGSLVANFEKKKLEFESGFKAKDPVKETQHERGRNEIYILTDKCKFGWNINTKETKIIEEITEKEVPESTREEEDREEYEAIKEQAE